VCVGSLPLVLTACLKGLYVLTAKAKAPTANNDMSNVAASGVTTANEARTVPKSLNQLYVLVVCVLILVQDGAVLRALRKHSDIDLRWYTERPSDAASYHYCHVHCFTAILCVFAMISITRLNMRRLTPRTLTTSVPPTHCFYTIFRRMLSMFDPFFCTLLLRSLTVSFCTTADITGERGGRLLPVHPTLYCPRPPAAA
jgi:hypothetical protein